MATIASTFYRDGNHVPITTDGIITKKTVTFAGATTDAWGDDAGARDGGVLFTVTGLVYLKVIGVVKTDCTGGGSTGSVGVTGDVTCFAATTTMTTLDEGEIWTGAETPLAFIYSEGGATPSLNVPPPMIISDLDVIFTTATANTDAGVIDFYAIWRPISDDGNVEASTV